MAGRRPRSRGIPKAQAAVVGANIRALRQRNGWPQAKLGELMGWPTNSTVCAAEGRRSGKQRGFTSEEVMQLAEIFNLTPRQLTTRCANCKGYPPSGFTCQTCGAAGTGDSARPDTKGKRRNNRRGKNHPDRRVARTRRRPRANP
jgi:transcriptional regulator with XRE-family HTH domain